MTRLAFLAILLLIAGCSASRSAAQQDTPVHGSERRAEVPNLGAGSPEVVGTSEGPVVPAAGPVDVLGAMVRAGRRISGKATWYCLSGRSVCTRGYSDSDMVAAIDTSLGFDKGDRVLVTHGGRSIVVTIVDVCGCPGDRLIDLTHGAFRRLANPDLGWIPVTLESAGAQPTLPATDQGGEP
jgi:rare lipoprotein A (peptidoglycan hydrolase)